MDEVDEPIHSEVTMRLRDAVGPVNRQLVDHRRLTEAKMQIGVML